MAFKIKKKRKQIEYEAFKKRREEILVNTSKGTNQQEVHGHPPSNLFYQDPEFQNYLRGLASPRVNETRKYNAQILLRELLKRVRLNGPDHENSWELAAQLFFHFKDDFLLAFPKYCDRLGSSNLFWVWLISYVCYQELGETDIQFILKLVRQPIYRNVPLQQRNEALERFNDSIITYIRYLHENGFIKGDFESRIKEYIYNRDSEQEFHRVISLQALQGDTLTVYQGFIAIDDEQLKQTVQKNGLHNVRSLEKSIGRRSVNCSFTLDPHIAEHFALRFYGLIFEWSRNDNRKLSRASNWLGKPTVGKFTVKKSDIVYATNNRYEQEMFIDPTKVSLVAYQFVGPNWTKGEQMWRDAFKSRKMMFAPSADVHSVIRLDTRLARKNKSHQPNIHLSKLVNKYWFPKVESKFCNATNSQVTRRALSDENLHFHLGNTTSVSTFLLKLLLKQLLRALGFK